MVGPEVSGLPGGYGRRYAFSAWQKTLSPLRRWKWQQAAKRFYARFIEPGSLCFDIGANVGDRTAVFLALGAKVVAVEPQPACAARLRRRGRGNLIVEQIGLGAEPGEATLRIADANPVSSMAPEWIERVRASGRFAARRWAETVVVEVDTLDALIERHGTPRFCKIDVEGSELQVLEGLSLPLPVLSFEFTPEYSEAALACIERLQKLGMHGFDFSPGETMRLVWEEWQSADAVIDFLEDAPRDAVFFGDVYAATKSLLTGPDRRTRVRAGREGNYRGHERGGVYSLQVRPCVQQGGFPFAGVVGARGRPSGRA